MTTLIIAVLIVLISSAICSGAEAALFSVSMIKVNKLAEESSAGKSLLKIKNNMDRPIAAIVVLNNIANIIGSVVIGGIATTVLGSEWIGFFSAGLTFMVIIFSEIIPKTLGERYSEKISLVAASLILFVSKIMSPALWIIEMITSPITGDAPNEFTTNESEIKLLASIGGEEGVIEVQESDIIKKVFELNNTTAKDIMSPRVSLSSLGANRTLNQVKDFIINSQHSRMVVCGNSIDDVLGIAMKDELLVALVNWFVGNSIF